MILAHKICAIGLAILGMVSSIRGAPRMPQPLPKQGPVPTVAAAISIAVKLWSPIYGAEHIARERPYYALLKNGIWTVHGSLPPRTAGGTAILKIRKSDGAVLLLSHYR